MNIKTFQHITTCVNRICIYVFIALLWQKYGYPVKKNGKNKLIQRFFMWGCGLMVYTYECVVCGHICKASDSTFYHVLKFIAWDRDCHWPNSSQPPGICLSLPHNAEVQTCIAMPSFLIWMLIFELTYLDIQRKRSYPQSLLHDCPDVFLLLMLFLFHVLNISLQGIYNVYPEGSFLKDNGEQDSFLSCLRDQLGWALPCRNGVRLSEKYFLWEKAVLFLKTSNTKITRQERKS